MRRLPLALGVLSFLFALYAAGRALAVEVPLTYERYPDESNQFHPYGYADLKPESTAPAGEWKLPPLNSKKPLYALVDIGERKTLFVLDATKPDVDYYDRLYFDEEGKRDLSHEAPIDGIVQFNDDQWNTEFQPINTEVTLAGKAQPYSFRPYIYHYTPTLPDGKKGPEILRCGLRVNCGYMGQFDADGKTYKIMIGDANGNGRFDDLVTFKESPDGDGAVSPQGDQVYISTQEKPSYYDGQYMANLWLIGNTLYDVVFDGAQLKMTLTPSSRPTSVLKVPNDVKRLSLRADGTNVGLLVYGANGRLVLPAGTYRLVSYQLERTEACGDKWRLGATAQKDTPAFTVAATGEAEFAFGEPFTPRVTAAKPPEGQANAGTRTVSLAFTIEGKGKERVTDFARVSGDKSAVAMSSRSTQLPKEPVYRIVKPDGEVVTSGSFEYG